MEPATAERRSKLGMVAVVNGAIASLIIPINAAVFAAGAWEAFILLAILQFLCGMVGGVCGIIYTVRKTNGGRTLPMFGSVLAILVGLGGPLALLLVGTVMALGSAGGAWGRPLRVRGRVRHPSLRKGSDWTRGLRPRTHDLDAGTRSALEALWLHDAQKEHASVPAFSRISWLLAAVGAPAELLEGAHEAAIQEIDHARRCFALAAGYGERSHSVEPMPELLVGALDLRGDPHVKLAVESLEDGCLLEDFIADVAEACVEVCQDDAALDVLRRIADEERQHAEFSWDLLTWLVQERGRKVRPALRRALARLDRVARPTAVSAGKAALVAKGDPAAMRRHGRIDDAIWAELWEQRLTRTRVRTEALLAAAEHVRAA